LLFVIVCIGGWKVLPLVGQHKFRAGDHEQTDRLFEIRSHRRYGRRR